MKRIKLSKKQILWILSLILTFGLSIFILAIKIMNPFKPSFYIFSSYTDQQTAKDINKKYTYKEYGDVSSFEYVFGNNKAIAGVTSDYSIISLINQGKIAPISKDVIKINNLQNNWESYFSDVTNEQMKLYDQYILTETQEKLRKQYPEYGSSYEFKFSDFVVPYFLNDKVIAYDTSKVMNELNTSWDPLNFKKIPTLTEAFSSLEKVSKEKTGESIKVQWTKNERENVALGSTKNDPKINWDTTIDHNNYEQLIDNFASFVLEGTGAKISDTKRNIFDTDSDVILNNLINPESKITAATIYNGDALDAYFGSDNFEAVNDGDRLRIIRTRYTIRVLDAFVISSSINKEDRVNILKDFNNTLFNGMFWSKNDIESKAANENVYSINGILRIFDYVNYTPAAKGAYEFIYEDYFTNEDGTVDEFAQKIYEVAKTDEQQGIYVKNVSPIGKEVLSKLNASFQRKLNGY